METFCSKCSSIFTGGDAREKDPGPYNVPGAVRYLHHDSFAAFQEALQAECMLCEMLKKAYTNEHGDFPEAIQVGTESFKISYVWETDVGWLGAYSDDEDEDQEEVERPDIHGDADSVESQGGSSHESDIEDECSDMGSIVEETIEAVDTMHMLIVIFWIGNEDPITKDFWLLPTQRQHSLLIIPIQVLKNSQTDPGAYAYEQNPSIKVVYTHHVEENPGSEACRALMRKWVDYCVKHDPCPLPPEDTVQLPTRVIDVGHHGDTQVHLHITKDSDVQHGRYMTLSHRWGKVNLPKCTKSKLGGLQKGFDVSTLPTTFRDAIEVTRSFGIRFLWIDSLCILQDSAEDWAQEAGMMGDVYHNCLVNIAATAAQDSDGGLFFKRLKRDAEHLEVEIDWLSNQEDGGTPPTGRISCNCWDPDLWNFEIKLAVVNTRG